MKNTDHEEEWLFSFGLCATKPGQTIQRSQAEELLAVVKKWAEHNGFGVGGGFRPFDEDDMKPFPLLDDTPDP